MLKMSHRSSAVPGSKSADPSQKPGVSKRIFPLVGLAFVLGMVMAGLVLWATSAAYRAMPMEGAPLIAALIGGGGAMAIGVGLMALLFHSNRSGWDDQSG